MYKYLFGPVPSRRLGMSLGVDLVPKKVCSLDERFEERYKISDLNKKIASLKATKFKNNSQKMSERILTVEEQFLNQ